MCIDRKSTTESSDYIRDQVRSIIITTIVTACFLLAMFVGTWHLVPEWELADDADRNEVLTSAIVGYISICFILTISGLVYFLLMLPITYHCVYRIRARFGLASETRKQALFRCVRSLAIGVWTGLGVLILFVIIWDIMGPYWPIGMVGYVILYYYLNLSLKAPSWLSIYKVQTLEDDRRQNLIDFAEAQGIHNLEVMHIEGSRIGREAIAAYSSRLAQPTVYLSDTLLDLLSPEELMSAFAHELAHARQHHIPKRLLMRLVEWMIALGCAWWLMDALLPTESHIIDLARFGPIIIATVWLVFQLLSPLRLYLYRRHETKANEIAMGMTGKPDVVASAIAKLHANNLLPNKWTIWEKLLFATHPSVDSIAAQALRYESDLGVEV